MRHYTQWSKRLELLLDVDRMYWDTKLTIRSQCTLLQCWSILQLTFWRYRHIIQSVYSSSLLFYFYVIFEATVFCCALK